MNLDGGETDGRGEIVRERDLERLRHPFEERSNQVERRHDLRDAGIGSRVHHPPEVLAVAVVQKIDWIRVGWCCRVHRRSPLPRREPACPTQRMSGTA